MQTRSGIPQPPKHCKRQRSTPPKPGSKLPAKSTTAARSILDMPVDVQQLITSFLPPASMLAMALTSKACRSAVQPVNLHLDITLVDTLSAMQGLLRLKCLASLKHVELMTKASDAAAGAHMALLALCPALADIALTFQVDAGGCCLYGLMIDLCCADIEECMHALAVAKGIGNLALVMPQWVKRKLTIGWVMGPSTCACLDDELDKTVLSWMPGEKASIDELEY